jgi:hypothetical protein
MLPAGYFYDRAIVAERRLRFPEIGGDGDVRMNEIVHNSGWYNQRGEEIGWGDMSAFTMRAFAERLHGDDIVLVITESGKCEFKRGLCTWDDVLTEYLRYVLKDGQIFRITQQRYDDAVLQWGCAIMTNVYVDQAPSLFVS